MSHFNNQYIKGLKPKNNAYYVKEDAGERGIGRFAVKVQASGSKLYYFIYFRKEEASQKSKEKMIKIGKVDQIQLKDAREIAHDYSTTLSNGNDPIDELEKIKIAEELLKKQEQQQKLERDSLGTFHDLIIGYTDKMKLDGKRTWKAVRSALEKEALAVIPADKKAKDVTEEEIIEILARMIDRGAEVQSNRVRSYLITAFKFGSKNDKDPKNKQKGIVFKIPFNPAADIPKQTHAEKVRDRVLNDTEVFNLLTDIEGDGFSFEIKILIQLCFLTGGQRPFELLALKWSNIDLTKQIITIPTTVSKNKKIHLVPLTYNAVIALEQLHSLTGHTDYLFPNRYDQSKPMPTTSLSQAIKRYREKENIEEFVPKDFRRTCKTKMGELGISKDIRDKLHNHAQNDVSTKHYDRYDYMKEKRQALKIWETWLTQEQGSNVISMNF